jgi:hypothetical protein
MNIGRYLRGEDQHVGVARINKKQGPVVLPELKAHFRHLDDRVTWGVDWGTHGEQSCCTIIKVLPDGVREVVAVEYGPPYHTPRQVPLTRATISQMMYTAGWQNSSIRQADLDKVEKVVRAVEATLRQST